MLRKYYYIKFGNTVQMLFNTRTEKGAIKKAEKLGEGVEVWHDNPEESWSAKLIHVTDKKEAA